MRGKGEFCFLPFSFCSSPLSCHLGGSSCTHPVSFHIFVFQLAPDPYTGYSVPWLLAILLPAHTAYLTAPYFHPCSDYSLPTSDDNGQFQFPKTRILESCSVCCSLSLTAWQLATIDNTSSFFMFQMFSQVPRLFGIQSSKYIWKKNWWVSSLQSHLDH